MYDLNTYKINFIKFCQYDKFDVIILSVLIYL